MTTKKLTTKKEKLNIMRGRVFHGVAIDMQNKYLAQIPWVISINRPAGEAIKLLDEVPLNTLFLVDDKYRLVGIATKNPELAKGCKGGAKKCQETCDSAYAERGGCAFILWDPWGGNTKCRFECNDQFDQDETIEQVWL